MTRRTLFLSALAAALRREKVDEAFALVDQATRGGGVGAAALLVRQGRTETVKGYGKARGPGEVFLLASITKPMTVAGVMILVDRGAVKLDDPVRKFIAEFTGGDRDRITVKHLLTHTSGLPDMLPENTDLRKKHAPLKAFVAGTSKTPLLFAPGTQVKYQSMGILLAAEIAERVTGQSFRDFLRKELFTPLGMRDTSLGLGGRAIPSLAQCQVPEVSNWDWNSQYWRDLGAPWGGAHAPAADVARFLGYFLAPKEGGPLRVATARQMVANQNAGLNKPWGLGFMIDPGTFGKQCSPRTFGHYGSTGTVAWADPETDLTCVLLTTKPAEQSRAGLLGPVSDKVSEAAAAAG